MVAHLDEGLDLAPLRQLLLAHTFRYLERVTLDASNDRVGIRPLLCSLIQLLDDNDLLAGLASLKYDRNLTYSSVPSFTSFVSRVSSLFRACILSYLHQHLDWHDAIGTHREAS